MMNLKNYQIAAICYFLESLSLECCQDSQREEVEIEMQQSTPHFASIDRHHENNFYLAKNTRLIRIFYNDFPLPILSTNV